MPLEWPLHWRIETLDAGEIDDGIELAGDLAAGHAEDGR